MTNAERLNEYRAKHLLSERALAEKIGISRTTLRSVLAGYSCSFLVQAKIDNFLKKGE